MKGRFNNTNTDYHLDTVATFKGKSGGQATSGVVFLLSVKMYNNAE